MIRDTRTCAVVAGCDVTRQPMLIMIHKHRYADHDADKHLADLQSRDNASPRWVDSKSSQKVVKVPTTTGTGRGIVIAVNLKFLTTIMDKHK